jgi:hypothetical protein
VLQELPYDRQLAINRFGCPALLKEIRNYRQLDAQLVDAWLNTVEAKQQIEAVGKELKSRNTAQN